MDGVGMSNYNQELAILQNAAHYVDNVIVQDEHRFDLLEELRSLRPSNIETPRFCRKGFVVLPEALLEQYSSMNVKCFMGLFPQINRAWMTIDNKIFLWSYKNESDFNEYDELDQVIMSAGLVKPRKGVFKNYVKYLLVLATMVEIVIVGVSFTNNDESELNLLPMKYSAPSDGIGMVKIQGTEDGRIFMAGQDGCLYELIYESRDGWFSKRCYKVNCTQSKISSVVNPFFKFNPSEPLVDIAVDDQRKILYTLSDDSRIDVYTLGTDGRKCSHVASIQDVYRQAKDISDKLSNNKKNFKLISIGVISRYESPHLHLIAVSSKGYRFYFATNGALKYLGVAEARPPFADVSKRDLFSKSGNQIEQNIHKAFAKKGTVIMADSKDEETDNLLCFNIEGEHARGLDRGVVPPVTEVVSTVEVEGRNLEIAEVPMSIVSPEGMLLFTKQSDLYINELVSQPLLPPREFVSLSSNGIYLLTKLRPVDRLAQILHQYGGPGSFDAEEALRIMIERYGTDEICAMCVMLASSKSSSAGTPASLLQSVVQPSVTSSPVTASHQVARAAQDLFGKLAGEPHFEPALPQAVRTAYPYAEPQLVFSSAHEAFFLFFSRVMRTLWQRPFMRSAPKQSSKIITNVKLPDEVLSKMQMLLLNLKEFFDHFPHLRNVSSQPRQPKQDNQQVHEEHQSLEMARRHQQQSLSALYDLTVRSLQALFLLDMLHQFKLPVLLRNFRAERLNRISKMTFRELVLEQEGEILIHDIVRNIVSLDQYSSVDNLCDMLRDNCSAFFTQADLHDYKAFDLLEKAKSIRSDPEQREQLLRQALDTYMGIAAHIDIAAICREFQRLGFYNGSIELALSAAEHTDPSGLGTEWYKSGQPASDSHGKRMFEARTACYNCVVKVFDELYRPAPTITSTPRKSPLTTANEDISPSRHVTAKEWALKRRSALHVAQSSRDELFHDILYNWLLQNNHREELIRMRSSFIESFLKRHDIDLLWQYYNNNEKFDRVAEILLTLAEKPDDKVNLNKRLEYLSKAISNAKAASGMGELLQTLQERMEVSKIQAETLKELKDQAKHWEESEEFKVALSELNGSLLSLTELYNRYCSAFELNKSALSCLCCAQYEDTARIRRLWVKIFDAESQVSFDNLINQMQALAAKYLPKQKTFFPLDYVATIAAQYHLEYKWDEDRFWFPRTMIRAKVPFDTLYHAYYAIYEDLYGRYAGGGDVHVPDDVVRLERNNQSRLLILANLGFIMYEWGGYVSSPAASMTDKQRFPLGMLENHLDMFCSNLGEFPHKEASEEKNLMEKVKTLFRSSPTKRRSYGRTSVL
eukprot:gb/GECH01003937.1/.p1 GENE.gb/GECH01003937.1/~~gb/GECH01003937.1/.p1  ORF type:complete len:1322 (+),score=261.03 gb/GECH01003937.1/:1-3966(+)